MMAQSPNESSPLFRSRPKDLSTRFLPTIANKELNPDDFIDPLEAQTFTAPVPFELINSLEANSSKPRIISGADAFAPSSRPISIDPELHRPKRDLSTRFLSTIDQLKSNPDDLLEPSRETQEDLASPFLHTTTAPIPITPTDIQQHYPSQAEWESPSMEFSIEDIASVRAIGYRDKPDLSTRYLPKIKSQIASVDELVLEMEDEPSSKSINPMHQHLVNPDDLIEECANLNEIGGQDITSNGSMIGNKKHNNAPLEVYSEEQSGNQDMGNIFSQQELFLSCEQSNHNYSTDSSNFESDDKGKNSSHSLLSSSSELSYSDLPFTRLSKVSMPSYVQNNVSSQSVRVSLSHSQDVENDYLEVEFLESNSEISSPDDASMLSEIYDESINNSATDPSMLGIAPSDIEDPLNYVQLNQDYTTPLPFPVHNQNYPQQGDGVVNPWPEAQGNYDQAQNWPQGTGYDQAHSWQAQGNYNQAQNWPQGTGYDQAHSWQTQGNYDHQAHSWQAHEGATQTPMWQVENSSDPFGQEDVSGGVSDPFGQEDVSGSVSDPFGQEDVSGSVSDPFGQEDISGSVSDPFGQEDISGSVSDPFGQEDVSGSVSDPFGQEDVSGGVSDPFGQEDVSGSVSDPFGQEDVSGSVSDPFEQMSFDSISSEQADGIGTGDMLLDISSDGDTSERENSPVFAIPSSQFTNSETNQPSAQELPEEFAIILSGAEDLLYEEDYLGAKYLLDVASKKAPDNEKIKSLRQLCDQKVLEIYREEFTSLDAIPERIKKLSDILSLDLDHRAGFVLSQIDGSTTISELLFLSGVKEDEIFMILGSLKHQGIIKIR
jgi:hypothetical protein